MLWGQAPTGRPRWPAGKTPAATMVTIGTGGAKKELLRLTRCWFADGPSWDWRLKRAWPFEPWVDWALWDLLENDLFEKRFSSKVAFSFVCFCSVNPRLLWWPGCTFQIAILPSYFSFFCLLSGHGRVVPEWRVWWLHVRGRACVFKACALDVVC